MKKGIKIWVPALMVMLAVAGPAYALNGVFVGQSGQYHQIPNGLDVQKLTLVGGIDSSCPDGQALYAVDEWGKKDSVPFIVPPLTLFLLADAEFTGSLHGKVVGYTPALFIWQTQGNNSSWDRAGFFANGPTTGTVDAQGDEHYVGQRSLGSEVAYPMNSRLCAYISNRPRDHSFPILVTDKLDSVIVHGTLINNSRTTAQPYFTW